MRNTVACAVGASVVLLIGTASTGQDLLHGRNSHWLGFSADQTISMESGPYRFTQEYEPNAHAGQIYIQRDKETEPHLIFKNQRYAEILIGHHGEQVLINYWGATKDFEVYSANIGTGENQRIDQQALRMFSEHSGADPSLIIVAAGEALSSDNQEALLSVNLIYISVRTYQEAGRVEKTFKKWWYAVSTSNGHVLREYRTSSVPRAWRTAYRQSGNEASRR